MPDDDKTKADAKAAEDKKTEATPNKLPVDDKAKAETAKPASFAGSNPARVALRLVSCFISRL